MTKSTYYKALNSIDTLEMTEQIPTVKLEAGGRKTSVQVSVKSANTHQRSNLLPLELISTLTFIFFLASIKSILLRSKGEHMFLLSNLKEFHFNKNIFENSFRA